MFPINLLKYVREKFKKASGKFRKYTYGISSFPSIFNKPAERKNELRIMKKEEREGGGLLGGLQSHTAVWGIGLEPHGGVALPGTLNPAYWRHGLYLSISIFYIFISILTNLLNRRTSHGRTIASICSWRSLSGITVFRQKYTRHSHPTRCPRPKGYVRVLKTY